MLDFEFPVNYEECYLGETKFTKSQGNWFTVHDTWPFIFWEDWEKMKLNELGMLKLERQNSLFAVDEAYKATLWLIPDLKGGTHDSLIINISRVETVISASKPS